MKALTIFDSTPPQGNSINIFSLLEVPAWITSNKMMLSTQQQRRVVMAARRMGRGIALNDVGQVRALYLTQRHVRILTFDIQSTSCHQQPTVPSRVMQHRTQSTSSESLSTTKILAATTEMNPENSNSKDNDTLESTTTPTETIKKSSIVGAYSDLAKAKLSALVVSTTAIGFVAAGGPLSCPWTLASCCLGTALLSSSAAAWNQILEVDRDKRMKRTQTRPLVQGIMTPAQAQVAAVAWGVTGTSMLVVGTNPLTASLGVANLALYAGLYTYMKPRSIYNTWIGAVVGAIPPLMGWTAAASLMTKSGADHAIVVPAITEAASSVDWMTSVDVLAQQLQQQLPAEAWWLAGVLYLWQMPHFLALSYMHRIDYRRGGFKMVSTVYPPEESAKLITRYAWYLTAMPFVAAGLLETSSSMFAMEGILLNAYALRAAYKFQYDQSNANARHVFLTSLWYLPSLLMLYLLHSKVWDEEKIMAESTPKVDDSLRNYLSDWIHQVRSKGREVCVHEQAALKAKHVAATADATATSDDSSHVTLHPSQLLACPIVVGKQVGHNSVEVAAHAGKEVVAAAATSVATAKISLEGASKTASSTGSASS